MSQQSQQVYRNPGQHYDPPQKAVLTNGRTVEITRQDGDGTTAWYFTAEGEKFSEDQIKKWK
jgi:hypothetical protein